MLCHKIHCQVYFRLKLCSCKIPSGRKVGDRVTPSLDLVRTCCSFVEHFLLAMNPETGACRANPSSADGFLWIR